MQALSLNELITSGYTEDRASRRSFEGRYGWLTVPGILIFVGAYPSYRFNWFYTLREDDRFIVAIICFAVGMGMVFAGTELAMRGIPKSLQSGEPMLLFLRSDAPPGTTEYIYVDQLTRTYFTRVVAVPVLKLILHRVPFAQLHFPETPWMLKLRKVVRFGVTGVCLLLIGTLVLRLISRAVYRDVTQVRATFEMKVIAEAVKHYRKTHGFLPSESQFADVPPAPDSVFPKGEGSEVQMLRNVRPVEFEDPWLHPYQYKRTGRSFMLFSFGEDGVVSNDDIVYTPE